jgi:V/A-type H+-transporting ATPase subunit D
MAEQINPTRMNLLAKRSQTRLARQGADLLNRKKDALLREFFDLVGAVHELRVRLTETLRREMTEAVVAEAVYGVHEFASAAAAADPDVHVKLTPRSLWGVRVADLEHDYQPRDLLARPASPRGTPLAVDELAAGFERIVRDMLDLAPCELRLRRIGEEIRRTNRRINALEQQVIPRLEAQARQITQILEERARDDVIRLKRLKQKKARSSQRE